MPSSAMIVPVCPSGVVFTREDFLVPDFGIDGFLAKYAGNHGLETLRDELGMYLQVLKVAMIELINDDYADFVNLSSNLVGTEDKIKSVQKPLHDYKLQISSFQSRLESTKKQMEAKLEQRKMWHEQRVALRNLEHIINSLTKVERLLCLNDGDDNAGDLSGDLVERVAADVNYLNFCVGKCDARAFVDEIQPRLARIGDRLHTAMEKQLMQAIVSSNKEVLKRFLRIYAAVDRIQDAENLIRIKIVSPYLEDIISSQSLHSDPLGLRGVCLRAAKIIPEKLDLVLLLTKKAKKSSSASNKMADFDIVGRALWPEIVEKFERNLPSIFSAGNPDNFHNNYITVMNFIRELEGHIHDVESFRQAKLYQNFIQKWNLPVYYQIRFQEIAVPVEDHCQDMFAQQVGTGFHLKSSDAVMFALTTCWRSDVFLQPLAQKFWKLSLQIIARYSKAVGICCSQENLKALLKPTKASSSTRSTLKTSETSLAPLASKLSTPALSKGHARSASDTGVDKHHHEDDGVQTEDFVGAYSEEELTHTLILVYLDVSKMAKESLPGVLPELIWPTMTLEASGKQFFIESLEESRKDLFNRLDALSKVITERVSASSCSFLKQVSDIPRLYRRTNRELPSKPCTYLVALLDPIQKFKLANEKECPSLTLHKWLVEIVCNVSTNYFAIVAEVLDAVQKMEESLRRLKRVREKNSSSSSNVDKGDKGVSDDDKIRLQLFVDVKHYIKSVEDLEVSPDEIFDQGGGTVLKSLDNMVVEATKSCLDVYLEKTSLNKE